MEGLIVYKTMILILAIAAVLIASAVAVPRSGYAQVDISESLEDISQSAQEGRLEKARQQCAVLINKWTNLTVLPCCGQETFEDLNFSLNHLYSAIRRGNKNETMQELNAAGTACRRMRDETRMAEAV